MPDTKTPETDSTPIGAKMSYPTTPATDSSARKIKEQKYYVTEDLESDPSSLDSFSREYYSYDDMN